jgi:predicted secreted acid phosphatase
VPRSTRMTLATAATLILVALVPACGAHAADPPPAPADPDEIIAYHDSGEWDRDISDVVNRATDVLERRLGERWRARQAVVLDIDDTSLSTYECLKRFDFDRKAAGGSCAESGNLPAIPQTLQLYRYAREHRVAVFFITGRRERLRRPTVANLRAAGFTGRLRVIMRPNRERPRTHGGFKARRRRSLERRGHEIVINLGDQRSDLDGGHAMRAFKLPNPMYAIPSG